MHVTLFAHAIPVRHWPSRSADDAATQVADPYPHTRLAVKLCFHVRGRTVNTPYGLETTVIALYRLPRDLPNQLSALSLECLGCLVLGADITHHLPSGYLVGQYSVQFNALAGASSP